MRVLLVHPSTPMYSEIFPRPGPLGLERVAVAVLADGHDVRHRHRPPPSRHG